MILLLVFSFLAGLVTVLSPCILPVLPLLLAAGVGQGKYRPWGIIIGLIISFSFFTLSLTALVHFFGISPTVLRYAAIVFMIFFGCSLLFPSLEQWLTQHSGGIGRLGDMLQAKSAYFQSGFLSGFIVGVALGLVWTPCAGPILASITTLAATRAVTLNAILITLAYSCGAALPMFFIMYGGNKIVESTKSFSQYSGIIRAIFGILMIVGALSIAFHADVLLQQFTLAYFPHVTLDENQTVKKELQKILPTSSSGDALGQMAPDFVGINAWINTEPLHMDELRGKVVLIDFWTYSCINCVRTLPFIKRWYDEYHDKGLVIVGVHTPEFAFEHELKNVQDAVKRFEIRYPVALDNEYKTWQAYNNHYWPAHFLIDKQGIIRDRHFGEGAYEQTEQTIRALLGLERKEIQEKHEARAMSQTPELYLGYARARNYVPSLTIEKNKTARYGYTGTLTNDHIGLQGPWFVDAEFIRSESSGNDSRLDLNFIANRVYLVMQASSSSTVHVLLDNQPLPLRYKTTDVNERGELQVHEARMYDLVNLQGSDGRHTLSLIVPQGVSLFAFTFGSGQQ